MLLLRYVIAYACLQALPPALAAAMPAFSLAPLRQRRRDATLCYYAAGVIDTLRYFAAYAADMVITLRCHY